MSIDRKKWSRAKRKENTRRNGTDRQTDRKKERKKERREAGKCFVS